MGSTLRRLVSTSIEVSLFHEMLTYGSFPHNCLHYPCRHPAIAPLLPDYGLFDKHPGDRLSIATTQILGMQAISAIDAAPSGREEERGYPSLDKNRQRFMKLARGYTHHGTDRVRICEINQAVALEAGDIDVAQTWGLLASLLRDLSNPTQPAGTHQVQMEPEPVSGGANIQPNTPGSMADKVKAKEPQSATRTRPKTPPSATSAKGENGQNEASASKRKRSGGAATLYTQPGAHNPARRDSSPSLLSTLRPVNRSPSSSPAHQPVKLPASSLSYTPGFSLPRPPFKRRVSISSADKSKSNSPGPTPEEKKPGWGGGSFAAVASGALEDSSSDEEGDTPSDGVVGQSDTGTESPWSREKKVAGLGAGIQHPTLGSSSSSSHSSPAIGGKNPLPPSHLINNVGSLLFNSKLASPQVHSQLLDIQDVNEDDGDESDGFDEDGASRSSGSASIRRSRSGSPSEGKRSKSRGIGIPPDINRKPSPPSPTLVKYIAKGSDSSQMATISRSGLRVMTRQDSDSATIVNQIGDLGMATSFGSSAMTPTIRRLSALGAWSKRETEAPKATESAEIGPDPRVGSAIRASPAGKNIPLRDLFSSASGLNGPASAIPTPTTAVSTQSGLRSTLTNGSSRFSKGQTGTLLSSIPPLSSAGPEQDSFSFHVDQQGEGSKWTEEHKDVVDEIERQDREDGFEIVKGSLEIYAEEGNVQMCAAMAMAAHEELGISPERMEQFLLGYLGESISFHRFIFSPLRI